MKIRLVVGLLALWAIASCAAAPAEELVIESDYQVEGPEDHPSDDGREGFLPDAKEEEEEVASGGDDKTMRRLVRVKTFTLPTRTRTRPIWYRPDWPSNKNSSIASTVNPALNSTTTSSTETTTADLPPTTVVDTTIGQSDFTSATELVQQEKWLLEAIEEVAQSVQDDLTPYQDVDQIIVTEIPETQVVKEALSQENSLLFTASSKGPAVIVSSSTVTSTPNPASISSAPLWIYGTRPTTLPPSGTNKPFVNRWTAAPAKRVGVTVGLSRFAGTAKPSSSTSFSTTTRSKPVSLITAAKSKPTPHPPISTTTHHKVARSTTSQTQSRDTSAGIPVTTEWWVAKPNFQFASLAVHDQGDVYDYDGQVDDESAENFPSELPPPVANPHFTGNDKSRPSTPRRPLSSQPPTPREPGIVQITPRTTTTRPKTTTTKTTTTAKTTAKTTTTPRPSVRTTTTTTAKPKTTTKPIKTTILTKRPPAVIPIRKPSVKPNQVVRLPQTVILRPPFPPNSGVTGEPGLFQEFSTSTVSPTDPTDAVEVALDYQDVRPVFPDEFADSFAEYDSELSAPVPDSSQEQVPINFVIVNIWNYIAGQLTLVGQQVVPAQMLAGVNITNGATIQSSSLPAQILSQLTGLFSLASTALNTTTAVPTTPSTPTTTLPPRPYGGVGNPTLVGIQPSVQLNNTLNDAPVPVYVAPSPSPTYGPPPPTTAAPSAAQVPSSSYDVPQAASLGSALPPPPSTSYGVPQAPPLGVTRPPPVYGVPPLSATQPPPSTSYGVPQAAPLGSVLSPPPSTSYGVPQAPSLSSALQPAYNVHGVSVASPIGSILQGLVPMFMSNFSSVSVPTVAPSSAPSQTYGPPPGQQSQPVVGYPAPSQTYTVAPFRVPQSNLAPLASTFNVRPQSNSALTSIGLISPETSASFAELEEIDLSDFSSVVLTPQKASNQRPPNRVHMNPNRGSSNPHFSQLQLKPPLTPPGPPHLGDLTRKPSKPNSQQGKPIKQQAAHNLNGAGRPQRRPGSHRKRPVTTNAPVKVFSTMDTTASSNHHHQQSNLNFNFNSIDSNKNQFAQAGHPLGALLPDFILESLAEQVHSVPLQEATFSRSSAFAPRFADSPAQPGPEAAQEATAPPPTAAATVASSDDGLVTPESISRIDVLSSTEMTAEEDTHQSAAGPMATEASDNNNAGPVTSGVIATRSKHPFATRPYAFGRPSNMELAYGDAVGSRLIPVQTQHYPSQSASHPLDVSTGNWQRVDAAPASADESEDMLAEASEQESSSANPSTTSTTGAAPTTIKKADRRFNILGFRNFMPAAAISAAAFSLPMLVGRKKRELHLFQQEQDDVDELLHEGYGGWEEEEEEEDDAFVRHFTEENEREMRSKDIASSNCRQLSVDESADTVVTTLHHLLVCPGRQSRTLNMILLDGLTRRR